MPDPPFHALSYPIHLNLLLACAYISSCFHPNKKTPSSSTGKVASQAGMYCVMSEIHGLACLYGPLALVRLAHHENFVVDLEKY